MEEAGDKAGGGWQLMVGIFGVTAPGHWTVDDGFCWLGQHGLAV